MRTIESWRDIRWKPTSDLKPNKPLHEQWVLHVFLSWGPKMFRPIVGLVVVLLSGARGQSPQAPSFEVATVKPAAPSATQGGRGSASGDTVTYRNTTLKNALARAFEVVSGNQIDGPSWILTERYDIVAKAPKNTPKEQIPLMLRTLLVERFRLKLHHEDRELRTYVLTTGKGRLKIQRVEDEGEKDSFSIKDGHREAKNLSMAALAQLLSLTLQSPVSDRTGLPGNYNFPLDFSSEETARDSAASIFTIVAELGLKLEAQKQPFDVIVVDAGDRIPTEN
jgi:uncharacterized protein (TIGR03435 family)